MLSILVYMYVRKISMLLYRSASTNKHKEMFEFRKAKRKWMIKRYIHSEYFIFRKMYVCLKA